MTRQTHETPAAVYVTDEDAPGQVLVVCEHASAQLPARLGTLGLAPAARTAHIAWDPGAEGLARGLARRLRAPLITAGQSRLAYDLNRPPNAPSAMTARSETFDIPGNVGLPPEERLRRTEEFYLPFHQRLHGVVARRLAVGFEPVLVTVHSFTPLWHGTPRAVELGVIHDADPALAQAVLIEAQARTGLTVAMNEPYDAADGVTHTLRLHATPYGLRNVMLEIRNDLIATAQTQDKMAETLADVLSAALARLTPERAAVGV